MISKAIEEKREFTRYTIELPAQLDIHRVSGFHCKILDYCQGGMLVQFDDASITQQVIFEKGDTVHIGFTLPVGDDFEIFRVQARIVRVSGLSLGLQFLQKNPLGLDVLHEWAETTSENDRPISQESKFSAQEIENILNRLKTCIRESLVAIGEQYFLKLEENLFASAKNIANATEQEACFAVVNKLADNSNQYTDKIIEKVIDAFDHPVMEEKHPSPDSEGQPLRLVEDDELDHWLIIRILKQRMDAKTGHHVRECNLRFSGIYPERDNAAMPVSPFVICNAYFNVIQQLSTDQFVIEVCNKTFEDVFGDELTKFYQSINAELQSLGVQPAYNIRKKQYPEIERRKNKEKTEPGLDDVNLKSTSRLVQTLLDNIDDEGDADESRTSLSDEEFVNLLSRLSKRVSAGEDVSDSSLKERALKLLVEEEADKTISNSHGSLIDVASAFTSFLNNQIHNTDHGKEWISKLTAPLVSVLLKDPGFLDNKQHPARILINQLSQLDQMGADLDQSSIDSISAELGRLLDEGDFDTLFDGLLDITNPLVTRYNDRIKKSEARLIESCEGQQRVESAKTESYDQLFGLLEGLKLPRNLWSLLADDFRHSAMLANLRQGKQSEEYNKAGTILGDIRNLAEEGFADKNLVEKMLSDVSGYIKDVSKRDVVGDKSSEQFVNSMLDTQESVLVEPKNILEISGEDVELTQFIESKTIQKEIPALQTYKAGDWFEYHVDGQMQNARLSWINTSYTRFVFVNRSGIKMLDLRGTEFNSCLESGQLVKVQESDLNVIDRGIDEIVNSLYSQLAYQASHDELTGLVNRREFERRLDVALKEAQERELQHMLCFIRVHQLEAIRKNHGHNSGNHALREIGHTLKDSLADKGTFSHMGVDEFCALIEECTPERAYKIANSMIDTVREFRYKIEDKSYALSVSIGIVPISSDSQYVPSILNEAELACIAAKNAGRNTVRLFEQDDEKIIQVDNEIEWLNRIHHIIDQDQLDLRVQKIISTDRRANLKPHYEVLLSVLDDNGKHLSPYEFITASERHNVMQEVDRWVINRVFNWLHENESLARQIEKLSINLSGQSLGSEYFMEYIFEQFSKYNVRREQICFEITETAAIGNIEDAADLINEVRGLGCSFSLDDFGSGLSSYSYLKNLPVDYIKIDGALVKDIAFDDNNLVMVKSICEIARFMGKKVIAEYVETQEIYEKLREIGADYVQGYWIAEPHPIKDLSIN